MPKTQKDDTFIIKGISPDTKRRFKAECARRGKSQKEVMEQFMELVASGKALYTRNVPGAQTEE